MTNKRLSKICIFITVLLTLIILLAFISCFGKTAHELITHYYWVLFFAVIVAFIAGWRSYADMKRLTSGNRSWRRPATEGFLFGFLPVPISHAMGMLQEAFAAGPPWPAFGYAPLADWFRYFIWLITSSCIFGILGALYAMLLSGINRILLRTIADNKAISADANSSAAD